LLAITEPDEKSSSTSGESEDNDKYDVAMDGELGCMIVNGDRGQPLPAIAIFAGSARTSRLIVR
jgi:hypothetical protein